LIFLYECIRCIKREVEMRTNFFKNEEYENRYFSELDKICKEKNAKYVLQG